MSDYEEAPPCSSFITVFAHKTVFKTSKWWCAAVAGEMAGKRKVLVYLWLKNDEGIWKRKGKLTIGSLENWKQIKEAVEGGDKSILNIAFGGG